MKINELGIAGDSQQTKQQMGQMQKQSMGGAEPPAADPKQKNMMKKQIQQQIKATQMQLKNLQQQLRSIK